jgi:hypothetical protein
MLAPRCHRRLCRADRPLCLGGDPRAHDRGAITVLHLPHDLRPIERPPHAHAIHDHEQLAPEEKAVPEYGIVDSDDRTVEPCRPDDSPVELLTESLEWQPDRDVPPLVIDLPGYFDRIHGVAW